MEKKKLALGMFLLIGIILFSPKAIAFEKNMCVDVHVTSIEPSAVEVGEETTVGIQIDNCGNKLPSEIEFKITRFSRDLKIKEPLTVKMENPFGYSDSRRFNIYHIYVSKNASPGEYTIEYELRYRKDETTITKKGSFTITVTSQEAQLDISYIKTDPIIPKEGEEFTLTVRIENFGKGDANSVKAEVDLPFFGVKQSFLGELESGEDSSAVFTLVPNKGGEISYNLVVSYRDDFGTHSFKEPLKINIEKKPNKVAIMILLPLLLMGIAGYYLRGKNLLKRRRK